MSTSLISEYEQSRGRVKLKFVQIRSIQFDENPFKFDSFDSTPTIGWSQIFINWIQFENLQLD